jgi:hypothetical protein
MLNTFDNETRFYHRRLERQRHLKDMETFSNRLAWTEETTLSSMADALSGFPLEKTRHPSRPAGEPPKFTRRHKVLSVLCLLAVVAISSLAFHLGRDVGEHDLLVDAHEVESTTQDETEIRRKKIFSLILDWGLTPREVLNDTLSAPSRAFHWLVYEDDADNVEAIRTRFALSTLYYSTQNISAKQSWVVDNSWLSSYPVCLWYGVECHDYAHSTIGLVKALNLSSNGLTGTLPDELSLLELDCRSLDVSNNAITGTLPETLFAMKNLGEIFVAFMLIIPWLGSHDFS